MRRDTDVRDIAELLFECAISAVPVLDDAGRVCGMVSEGDLINRADAGSGRRMVMASVVRPLCAGMRTSSWMKRGGGGPWNKNPAAHASTASSATERSLMRHRCGREIKRRLRFA